MNLELKNIDLIIIDCIYPQKALAALCHCANLINFGNVHFFSHEPIFDMPDYVNFIKIDKIDSIEKYSDFCLRLNDYIHNDFTLLIQTDGFILNPELWSDKFFDYDYIGCPFPNFGDLPNEIGNGGFCLRSKKFLEYSATYPTTNGEAEDIFLAVQNYQKALDYGIKFPSREIALKFSSGYNLPQDEIQYYSQSDHFGFHNRRLLKTLKEQRHDLIELLTFLER